MDHYIEKIGTDFHEVRSRSHSRYYILEKWRTRGGYELLVRRSTTNAVTLLRVAGEADPEAPVVTTYMGPLLEPLLLQARSDLDEAILR